MPAVTARRPTRLHHKDAGCFNRGTKTAIAQSSGVQPFHRVAHVNSLLKFYSTSDYLFLADLTKTIGLIWMDSHGRPIVLAADIFRFDNRKEKGSVRPTEESGVACLETPAVQELKAA